MQPAKTFTSAIIRIWAVILAVSLVWATPQTFQIISFTDGSWFVYPVLFVAEAAFFIWVAVHSDAISSWLVGDNVELVISDSLSPEALCSVILACIGIYMVLNELPATLYWLIDYDRISLGMTQIRDVDADLAFKVQIAQGLIKIAFGFGLIFGVKKISFWLKRSRGDLHAHSPDK